MLQVVIDDTPLTASNVLYWRRSVGVAMQEPLLFDGTIADNIRIMKPDASNSEIEAVLEQAYATDFVHKLEMVFCYFQRQSFSNNPLSGHQ